MPPKKRLVPTPAGEREGVVVEVNEAQEHFNQYMLEDGTILRTKTLVVDVVRVDGVYDNDGNPLYYVKSSLLVTADSPDALKRKG